MNELKKPTSLLAGTNVILTIGSFMYLYKKMEDLQNENIEMKKNMQILTTKLQKISSDETQKTEILKELNKDIKHVKENVSSVELFQFDGLNSIVSVLRDEGLDIKLPKKKKNKKNYKHFSSSSSSSASSSSSYEEVPRKKNKKAHEKHERHESENDDIIKMLRQKRNG